MSLLFSQTKKILPSLVIIQILHYPIHMIHTKDIRHVFTCISKNYNKKLIKLIIITTYIFTLPHSYITINTVTILIDNWLKWLKNDQNFPILLKWLQKNFESQRRLCASKAVFITDDISRSIDNAYESYKKTKKPTFKNLSMFRF